MKIILLLSSFIISNLLLGQAYNKLNGKWQAESPKLTSMNFDTYQFDEKGRFQFKPNAYNGLNRILSINGSYSIKGDSLYFTPEYTNEIKGGEFIRSESTTLSDTWEIVNGQMIKNLIPKKNKQSVTIKFSSDAKSFILDDRMFFKIE